MLKVISIFAAIALFGSVLMVHESNAGQTSPAPGQDQSLLDVSGFGQALSGANLGALSGRQALSASNLAYMTTSGILGDNTLQEGSNSSLQTGYNSISGNAFNGSTGFPTVIQNSGNQVLIQNDLIVNVTLTH